MSNNEVIILRRASVPFTKGRMEQEIVLCERKDEHTPYVTWIRNIRDGALYYGNYFSKKEIADQNFEERCQRTGAKEDVGYGIDVAYDRRNADTARMS